MVVLTHPLVLWLMLTFAPPIPSWLLFAICTVVPWAAALAALRSPASNWLTGSNPAVVGRPNGASCESAATP